MADLIAQGENSGDRWRRAIASGAAIIGRGEGVLAVDWDDRVSRRHAEVRLEDGRLQVRKISTARNPIFVHGKEADEFCIQPGEHFVIGRTTFTLIEERADVSEQVIQPREQQTFSAQFLQQAKFRNARARVDVLSRLPEVIAGASNETELLVRVTGLLMAGIPTCDAVALVRRAPEEDGRIEILHWDRRRLSPSPFSPSESLIREALAKRESVLYQWGAAEQSRFTAQEEVDWAFCTPVEGEACRDWAVYVCGSFAGSADNSPVADGLVLQDDLKFTEVAAATLRSLTELRLLQQRHAGLRQFFSPLVLESLAAQGPEEALRPRETDVSVLFCDLRGFSRQSEQAAGDLLGLLGRVSQALGVTTGHILEQGGVVGDFQGDAVMGFWGWPITGASHVENACRAALAIRAQLDEAARRDDDPLSGFQLGVGIATGRAVAGKIGTADHVKVTVFGPVVNLASRLEGMTKQLRASILLDEATARYVRQQMAGTARCRRLAVVRPYGMEKAVEVSELLPPVADGSHLSDAHIARYEAGLDAFLAGDWATAFDKLHQVPAEDRAKDFLTVLIAQHNRTAPPDFRGVIDLPSK